MSDDVSRAGASVREWAADSQLEIDVLTDQVQALNLLIARKQQEVVHRASGSRGERQVAAALAELPGEWCLLLDRHWPGTSRGNIDALAVGPGGVAVIDAKNWREARIEGDMLWRGQEPTDGLAKLLDQTYAVEQLLAGSGLAPTEIVPILVLVGRRRLITTAGRVQVLGDLELAPSLARRGVRLTPEQVDTVVRLLDRDCPPNASGRTRQPAPPRHASQVLSDAPGVLPHETSDTSGVLIDERAIIEAMREAAAREPIESWMTWLHPAQATLVRQSWNGPARIRGAAGTGKTVVALHRAKYFATHGKRVLVTSFVRTLPQVQSELFDRLAPGSGGVEFVGVHAWARRLLSERGGTVHLDDEAVTTCFSMAWLRHGRGTALEALNSNPNYWRHEIDLVIKSRGITEFGDYARLNRVGRGTALQPTHREAVWALHSEYERLRGARGLHDWADVLLLALEEVRREPADPAYDAVIVDEVQDLTCVGVRLLHALVGDAPDGLLLVGDGQQAVYPGGFSLSEAGVSVVGRSRVLERNYRNAGEILRVALAVVADDGYDDLDVERLIGTRSVDVEREGGHVVTVRADDAKSQESALVTQIREAHEVEHVRLGDLAVLCPSNVEANAWAHALRSAGLAVQMLTDYRGRTTDAVKVGTYARAKGLEFAFVLLPDHDRTPWPRRATESDDAYRERAELQRRQLFVAMTRARDGLWLGSSSKLVDG